LRPGNVDIRSDIYSLGCTLYTIILGEVPYPSGRFGSICSKMAAHVGQSPPSLLASGVAASPEIEAILQKMCAKDPNQRFATPQELLEAIDECQCADVREHRTEQRRREQYKQLGEDIIKASTAEDWEILAAQFREMDGYRNTADLAEKCEARCRKLKERREEQERLEQYRRPVEAVKKASTAADWRNLAGQVLATQGCKTTDELAKEYHER
jgi:serine/threonine protein kinase